MVYVNNAQEFINACEQPGDKDIFLNCDISAPEYSMWGKGNLKISAKQLTRLEVNIYGESGNTLELDNIHFIVRDSVSSGLWFCPNGTDISRLIVHNTCRIEGLIWNRGNITEISGDELIYSRNNLLVDGNGIVIKCKKFDASLAHKGFRVRDKTAVLKILNSDVKVCGEDSYPGIDLYSHKNGASLLIEHSTVEAVGGASMPGIGISNDAYYGTVTIKDSTVIAKGGDGTDSRGPGAGIGGPGLPLQNEGEKQHTTQADKGCIDLFILENSNVTATGGNAKSAACGSAAGIGTGGGFDNCGTNIGEVHIDSSTVTVKCGSGETTGAAIGGGGYAGGEGGGISYPFEIKGSIVNILLPDGDVCAPGAGIGGGASQKKNGGNAANIKISDSIITAPPKGDKGTCIIGGGASVSGARGTVTAEVIKTTIKANNSQG